MMYLVLMAVQLLYILCIITEITFFPHTQGIKKELTHNFVENTELCWTHKALDFVAKSV